MDAWKNGKLYARDELTISAYDHGFLYGLGFFETFRTYDGHVFLFDEHWKRLCRALADYRMTMPYDKETVLAAICALTKENNGEDGYFRLNISAGVHDIGLQPSYYEKPTVILFRKALHLPPRGTEKKAIWLKTTRNSPESAYRHKSHHFANNIQARFEVESLATHEGVFLTAEGYIAEGVTSNIFWVKDKKISTPSLATGILAGITREWILHNFEVEEGLFTKDVLESTDEVFITNAVQEIVPIKEIEGRPFLGNQGPVYTALHEAYVKCIQEERTVR
ncbi:aminodeoxychorismate lyase [Psychrobacillus sp. NEAU-3TGS]|uniref:aminodeoxychorismate lyase n=1 Tax=Psychrobacillus sp. NEAU-3TGS TaxID=2995412 RepID=UPI002496A0B0|nr:aminodeoxychorismate lyase [Psychrobacillus sp. NEAU-3TGS]MDI2585702.1 aminodeoxychorismate lyase [Psychrobacillus sp. NEAU-3TGS]